MSAQQTINVEFDISSSSLSKLQAIMTGGNKGGAGGLGGGKGTLSMITQLSGIALGVVGLVSLVKKITSLIVDSSPMLKQVLKLFNTAIMFIFRPIGDFIGFFLRPIMIFFLTTIALPFYKDAMPALRKLGNLLGTGLLKGLTQGAEGKPGKSAWEEGFGIEDWAANFVINMGVVIAFIAQYIDEIKIVTSEFIVIAGWIMEYFGKKKADVEKNIQAILTTIESISTKLSGYWTTIQTTITTISTGIAGVKTTVTDIISSITTTIDSIKTKFSTVQGTLDLIWKLATDPIYGMIGRLNALYVVIIQPIVDTFKDFTFPDIPKILTDLVAGWVFPDIAQILTDLVDDWTFPDVGKMIEDFVKEILKDPTGIGKVISETVSNTQQDINITLDVNGDGAIDMKDAEAMVGSVLNYINQGNP